MINVPHPLELITIRNRGRSLICSQQTSMTPQECFVGLGSSFRWSWSDDGM